MRVLGMLIKKELLESIKRRRLLALAILFIFFALLSPVTAKFMPNILEELMKSEDMGGLQIKLPDPTYLDAYRQLFKNLSQMGILVVMLIFMNIVSGEKSKGTAVLVLTKCVPRQTFVISKYIASLIVFILTYSFSMGIYLYYTYLLFGKAVDSSTLPALLLFGLYSVFILSMTLFASTVTSTTGGSAIVLFVSFFLLSIISSLPYIKDYSPMVLGSLKYPLDINQLMQDYQANIVLAIILSLLLIIASVGIFRKQEL